MADSLVIGKIDKKEPYWIAYIRNRTKKNKNFLGIITGPTGSGKSYSGLSICYAVDSTFTPERIITSMKELMALINNDKVKNGQCILWDEAGVDISSRSWQSLTNKMINFLLQTFRHKNFVLIFTTPYMDFIDSSTRKLFHAEFVTQQIDFKKKVVKLKPYLIQYNGRNKKFYYKYLRVATKLGVAPIKLWSIPKPPKWMVVEYERKKQDFTKKLNKDIEAQLNVKENTKPLTILQQTTLDLMNIHKDVDKVAKLMGVTSRTTYFHINRLKNKGYLLDSKENIGNEGKEHIK